MRELQPLPLGTSDFSALRSSGQIYVDKTALVYEIASNRQKFFLSRPRRFGKSLLISTFESLFKYGLRDFEGLFIGKLWKDKGTYQVVRLDFSNLKDFSTLEQFRIVLDRYLMDFMQRNCFVSPIQTTEGLRAFTNWLAVQQKNSVVLLIDEYDAPLTTCLSNPNLFEEVRRLLATLYAAVKSNDGVIRFFFMTGITKFNKTSIFSELNTLTDISLDADFGTLLGYTEEEIQQYFGSYLERAQEVLGLSYDELLTELRKNYDGFCFDEETSSHVYAPWSVLNLLSRPRKGFQNYWFESGGRPSALLQYLKSHALRNPEEYNKQQSIALSTLSSSADAKTLSDLGLLTQAGYLTLKKVVGTTAYLGYPNEEVRSSMAHLYTECLLAGRTVEQVGADNIAYRLAAENAESALHILNRLFSSIDYQHYPVKDESSVRAFIQVFFSGAGLTPIVEQHNHMGRSDLEVRAGNRYWVMEFKVCRKGQSSKSLLQEAVEQVCQNEYGKQVETGELIRVALVFSQEKRKFVEMAVC